MNKMSRYKKLMIALAAVASIYLVRATGLDQGMIDEVLNAAVESVVGVEDPAPVELPDAERADAEMLEQGGR